MKFKETSGLANHAKENRSGGRDRFDYDPPDPFWTRNDMTQEDQIIALALMDGWKRKDGNELVLVKEFPDRIRECSVDSPTLRRYLTSLAAIISVGRKQPSEIQRKLTDNCAIWDDPAFFARILLEVTGKWKPRA